MSASNTTFWKRFQQNSQLWYDYFATHFMCRCLGVVVNLGHMNNLGGDFKEYIFYEDMKARVDALKKGLDPKSSDVVDLLVERIKKDGNMDLKRQTTYIRPKTYLNQEEWDLVKTFLKELPRYKKEYPLPIYEHLPDTFFFHKGLKLLPPKAIAYLKEKDFIDGGAYIGDTALVLREYSPRRILSFDISDDNVDLFRKTMKMNSVEPDQCQLITSGLGEKDETIYVQADNGLGAHLHQEGDKKMQIRSIDSVAEELNLRVGLIKLDIEGFETPAMRGAIETMKRDRPILSLSLYHTPQDFFELKPYLESLGLGYRFMIRQLVSPSTPHMPFLHKYFWYQHVFPISETTLIGYPEELAEDTLSGDIVARSVLGQK